jgi:integrase
MIPTNPVAQLERSERPRVEREILPSPDRAAVGRLITSTPERHRVLRRHIRSARAPAGEALGLRWQDVDTRESIIRVRVQLDRRGELVEPKTAAARRDVPMSVSLSQMLAAHASARAEPVEQTRERVEAAFGGVLGG